MQFSEQAVARWANLFRWDASAPRRTLPAITDGHTFRLSIGCAETPKFRFDFFDTDFDARIGTHVTPTVRDVTDPVEFARFSQRAVDGNDLLPLLYVFPHSLRRDVALGMML